MTSQTDNPKTHPFVLQLLDYAEGLEGESRDVVRSFAREAETRVGRPLTVATEMTVSLPAPSALAERMVDLWTMAFAAALGWCVHAQMFG